ncbi:MAG: hypothetical protein ABL888_02640 [Pirellulaceae bacterium]
MLSRKYAWLPGLVALAAIGCGGTTASKAPEKSSMSTSSTKNAVADAKTPAATNVVEVKLNVPNMT